MNKDNTGSTYPWVYSWEIQGGITKEIKVYQYAYDEEKRIFPEQEYLTYYTQYGLSQFPLEVNGYNRLVQVMSIADTKYQNLNNQKYPYITINPETSDVLYFTSSGVSISFKLTLPEKFLDSETLSNVEDGDLVFDVSNDTMQIHLVLQSLTIRNPKYNNTTPDSNTKDGTYIGWINGVALVKHKK